MTRDEIVSFVCSRVGQIDTASQSACADYVKRRYQMIYDAYPWRDSQMTGTAMVTGGTNTVALPPSMERVIAIRAAGSTFLEPVDANLLLQVDPTIFERSGTPLYYEEYTDTSDNSKNIKVYPKPTTDTALFIAGKRARPELTNGTDSPILRNIDNALIAFVTADMYARQRQVGKEKAKVEEGGALLDIAKSIETQQANQPRRTKQTTVAGNSLAELADAVCARFGKWSLEYLVLAKEFLRRNYQAIYDMALWPESTVIASVDSDGSQIILPEYFDRVIAVRANASLAELGISDINAYFTLTPQIFEQTGTAAQYSISTPVAVAALPPTREKLSMVSTSASDKGEVFVRGETAGIIVTETVTLNGTTPVQTVNTYDTPLTIAKGQTAGSLIVTGYTSGTALVTILAAEPERKHMRLWVQPGQSTNHNCLILGKRRITPLIHDNDTPMLRDIQASLIELTVADMFSRDGNKDGEVTARAKAKDALDILVALETKQNAHAPRVIPFVDSMYSESDWLTEKANYV